MNIDYITLSALIISILALIYTVRTYLLKSGEKVRGSYGVTSTVDNEDIYLSRVTLENLKDRAIVIFSIYLQVGENYYIELEDFEEEPLILKPFEVYRSHYDPILFYSVNTKRIKLDDLIEDRNVKKKIILSTSNGKHVVKPFKKHWNPISLFFKNHLTAVVSINRLKYKGIGYGSNIKYLIELSYDKEEDIVIKVHQNDYQVKKFKSFTYTKECLENKDTLKQFMLQQREEGKIDFVNIEVHDFKKAYLDRLKSFNKNEIIEAKYYGKMKYHIIGKLYTVYSNLRLKYENNKIKRNNQKKIKGVNKKTSE
ncbi:hypothetical protein D1B33_09795 [Lysinibacillus yapensis]|uniref:Uncharacterized protein n=1 Tax=Ureibacillus yapensis TaxID=2304605 RepID=A0A396SB28_9BACL|nr:hypothetical protein [Lysinibacillus yapensis]RHW36683.1 hypothetical protein D1B33_09795 [Lysinibacillus yapensis]